MTVVVPESKRLRARVIWGTGRRPPTFGWHLSYRTIRTPGATPGADSTVAGFYGDGSDGAVTIATDTTLTRDAYYASRPIDPRRYGRPWRKRRPGGQRSDGQGAGGGGPAGTRTLFRIHHVATTFIASAGNGTLALVGGGSGGGGGGGSFAGQNARSGSGGGGGGGGGFLAVFAHRIENRGTIDASGGDGGHGGNGINLGGAGGGGAGGGGGAIYLVYDQYEGAGVLDVSKGALGPPGTGEHLFQ